MRLFLLFIVFLFAFQNCEDPPPVQSSQNSSGAGVLPENDNAVLVAPDVDFAPRFIRQPDSYTRKSGGSVRFQVEVQDAYKGAAKYFWYRNGQIIANQNQSELEIKDLKVSDSGSYHVVARIGEHLHTSESGSLTIVVEAQNTFFGDQEPVYDNNQQLINFNWTVSSFTPCTKACGLGVKSRSVTCTARPSNAAVDASFCRGTRPDENSECQGTDCGITHEFTSFGGVTGKASFQEVQEKISAHSAETAERIFSSDCDQGKNRCRQFNTCEYTRIPGLNDEMEKSFCKKIENGVYLCHANCR